MICINETFFIIYNDYVKYIEKTVINKTAIGTHTTVVHVTDRAVTFLSIP